MGRVTVFGSDDCPHCSRAKAALRSFQIPFEVIDLIQHPYRRNDMLNLTNEYSIPQVFFNDEHIGGADELMFFLDKLALGFDASSVLEEYEDEYGSKPDPSDPRLRIPTEEEEKQANEMNFTCLDPLGYQDTAILLPNGEEVTVSECISILDEILDIKDRTLNARTYLNCFVNTEAVTDIADHFQCKERSDAVNFARDLQQKYKIIDHVSKKEKHEFRDGGVYYFRMQCYHQPLILNSYRNWTMPVKTECANMTLMRLRKFLGSIISSHTNIEGLVDYIEARKDEKYPVFEEAICVVQAIDMSEMDEQTRLSFGLNLYNLMISYAFIKLGIATTSMRRSAFFNKVKFNVGGHILSFNDLENGILRANKRHPYAMSAPFAKDDPKRSLSISSLDCRIHFGLNCGAKSCPPVKYFRSESVDEELRVVALSFCEQDETCFVDEENQELSLSMLMKWFEKDFCSSKDKLPEAMLQFLKGEKKEALSRMIEKSVSEKKPISIKYLPYDWSTPTSRFVPYKTGNFKSDKFSPQALLTCEGKWNMSSKAIPVTKFAKKLRKKFHK